MSSDSKDRLFIKRIDIANCKRFFGTGHTISLSDSIEKNITIIIGLSGRGKSTIHDLIYWCFYGEFKNQDKEMAKEVDYGLVNVDALDRISKGESVTASVEIALHDDSGLKYLLTRELKATFNQELKGTKFEQLNNSRVSKGIDFESSVRLVLKDESGSQKIEPNPAVIKNEIRKNLPKLLSDFFLFDGENLIKFRDQSVSSKFIKDGITKISGLGIVNYLSENSKKTADNIQSFIGKKSQNSAPFAGKKEILDREIRETKEEIETKKRERDRLKILKEQTIKQIDKNKSSQKLSQEQKDIEAAKKNRERDHNQNDKEFKEFLFENMPHILIRNTLMNSEDIFSRLEREDKIPPSISSSAIDKILNSNPLRCVCGREFEKNDNDDEPWTILTRMKNTIIEDDLSQAISLGRNLLSQIIDNTSAEKLKNRFNSFGEKRRDTRREIHELESKRVDIDNEIKEIIHEKHEHEDLVDKKNKYDAGIDELSADIYTAEMTLESKETEWKDNKKRLEEIQEREGKYRDELDKITLGNAVHKFSKELEKRIEEILIEKTQKATNQYFLESAPEKETFDHVNISKDYEITVHDTKDRVATLSKGQSHVLGLSYVAGIRKITSTKTFLIIDSPLHNISGSARNDIAEIYSKYLPDIQIVLLVTDSEYLQGDEKGAGPVQNILRKKNNVWKEYVLEKEITSDGIESRKIMERT